MKRLILLLVIFLVACKPEVTPTVSTPRRYEATCYDSLGNVIFNSDNISYRQYYGDEGEWVFESLGKEIRINAQCVVIEL